MKITVVNISNKDLFDGAKVINIKSKKVREIKVLPPNTTISEAVNSGLFDVDKHIDYDTVMLNKALFNLVNED